MDMSVKLNLSYPAPAPANTVADQSAAAPPAGSATAATATTDSKDSDSDSDAKKLKTAVQAIEKFVQSVKRNLEFSIDQTSGTVVVKVIASQTGEVIRQIPSEEALKLADSLSTAGSVLFDGKV